VFQAYFILYGYALGLSLAAPPGPVNALIANESMKSTLHGSSIGAGAMTADAIFLFLIYSVRLVIPVYILKYLYLVGGGVMIYLSYAVLKSNMQSRSKKGNYFVGLTMGLTNPFQIIWWITAGLFLINRFSMVSMGGFFLGIVTWILIFPALMSKVNVKYSPYVRVASSSVLIIFGAYMILISSLAFL
jgi:threonine/homoserine/homoserine lactone efflux protein